MNLLIFSILFFIFIGTKFINYYYKFFYMYKQLNNYEKFKYFSNNSIVKIICKNSKFKTFFSIYVLTPLIKINYLIITTLIYLLCALCDKQLDDILLQNGFNNLNNSYDYEESPIINFTENSELQKLNEKINSSDNSLTSLKTDVDFFMNTLQNVQDNTSPNKIQENFIFENISVFESDKNTQIKINDKLEKIIDFKIVDTINEEAITDSNNNDNLNDFLVEENNIYNNFNDELKDFIFENTVEDKINEKNVKDELDNNKVNEINELNNNNEVNEIISIEEVDFGEYVNNLIRKTSEEETEKNKDNNNSNNEKINNTIPTKIKIGKKRK